MNSTARLSSRFAWRATILLTLLLLAMIFTSLHTLGNINDRAVALVMAHQQLSVGRVLADFGVLDATLLVGIAAIFLLCVRLEIKSRGFSNFIASAPTLPFAIVFTMILA